MFALAGAKASLDTDQQNSGQFRRFIEKKSQVLSLLGFKRVLWTIQIRLRCLNFAPVFLWTWAYCTSEKPACMVTDALKMAKSL